MENFEKEFTRLERVLKINGKPFMKCLRCGKPLKAKKLDKPRDNENFTLEVFECLRCSRKIVFPIHGN